MTSDITNSTLYFDGACPLCAFEIKVYRRLDRSGALTFVDVSADGAQTPPGVTQADALARFHVRTGAGRLVSGAAAFVEVWSRLPGWRHAARLAALPGALALLELGYRVFLPLRPFLSGLLKVLRRRRPA